MPKKIRIALCLGFILSAGMFPAGRVFAQDADGASDKPPKQIIAPGTFENLLKAAVKMEAFDLNDDAVIDDFAKVVHCDIYRKYFPNEFDWRRVRVAMRQSVQNEMQTYPTLIYLERKEHVGKYDFSSGILALQPESIMRKTGLLELSQSHDGGFCGAKLKVLPTTFIAALDNPIQLEGIELGEEEARTVVEGLQSTNHNDPDNVDRLAYGRYVVSLESVQKSLPGLSVSFTAHLKSIIFYEDSDFQKPFWSGVSSSGVAPSMHQNTLDAIPFKGIDDTTAGK